MHIQDIFQAHPTTFSFEFFPPKTDAASEELFANIAQLQMLQPSFVSVTYGAGGSTRERTHDLVVRIQRETNLTAVSHLTCVCHTPGRAGRDPRPLCRVGHREHPGPGRRPAPRTWPTTTARRTPSSTPTGWSRSSSNGPTARPAASASASPASPRGIPPRRTGSRRWITSRRKVDAGADYICTQLFFDNRDFYDFRERCELAGIQVPIVAGIMPITSKAGMVRMAELALGARFPAALLRAVEPLRRRRRGGRQRRHPLGDRAVPRPARQQRPRHPLLHAQQVRRDAADLREPRRQGLAALRVR